MRSSHNPYSLKEDGHFLHFRGSRAGLFKQLIYGGFSTPSAFPSLKLGAAVSPIDKLLKDSALPPVTSEKPTLFFREAGIVRLYKDLTYHKIRIMAGFAFEGDL